MRARTVHLEGWGNVPYPTEELSFDVEGAAVDLTGKTFALDVLAIAGEGEPLISLDSTASTSANGIRASSAIDIIIQIDQPTMKAAWEAALEAGLMDPGKTARLAYDLRVEDEDGFAQVWIEGDFIIKPGVAL